MNAILVERLKTYVERRQNILISGGTGTGKTTLLNALGKLISDDDRILLIEDTSEIQLQKPNLVRFEARQAQSGLPAVAVEHNEGSILVCQPTKCREGNKSVSADDNQTAQSVSDTRQSRLPPDRADSVLNL